MNYYVGLYVIPGYTEESGHGKHAACDTKRKISKSYSKIRLWYSVFTTARATV